MWRPYTFGRFFSMYVPFPHTLCFSNEKALIHPVKLLSRLVGEGKGRLIRRWHPECSGSGRGVGRCLWFTLFMGL